MRIELRPHNRPVSSKVARIELKVQRADKHIHDLRVALDAFYRENRNFLVREIDPESGDHIFKISSVPEVPPMISAIAGDVLFDLRSALDHLTYQIVTSHPVTSKKGIFFPFGESEIDYMASEHRRVIEEACRNSPKKIIERFDALKPYKGGNDLLWQLCRLNNIDKHRLLLTTAMRFKHRTFTGMDFLRMRAAMPNGDPGILTLIQHTNMDGPIEPLKVGDVIYRKSRVIKLHKKLEFSFEVGIHEPKVMDCESLAETLYLMLKTVENLIVPRFADLL